MPEANPIFPNGHFKDRTGQRFGRLILIRFVERINKSHQPFLAADGNSFPLPFLGRDFFIPLVMHDPLGFLQDF